MCPSPRKTSVTRREQLLIALREAGGRGISGESMASELGISRVAIAQHIAALRDEGYAIRAQHGRGYSLVSSPDLPLPYEVSPLIKGSFTNLVGGRETGSTNEDAKRQGREGAPEGTVVLALRQTAGRGRLGRVWHSPEGGLYLTFLLRPKAAPGWTVALGLLAGLSVVRALESLGDVPVGLKWPNDVFLMPRDGAWQGGKLVGILTEMAAQLQRVDFIVVGIGINVHRPDREAEIPLDNGGRYETAYLSDVFGAATPRLADVAASVIDSFEVLYRQWVAKGYSFAVFKDEYEERLSIMGDQVRMSSPDGRVIAEGEVMGIDEIGCLLIHTADGSLVHGTSGDVTLR